MAQSPERGSKVIIGLFAAHNLNSAVQPISFIGENMGTRDAFEGAVTCDHIKPDSPLQFAQTNGTEM